TELSFRNDQDQARLVGTRPGGPRARKGARPRPRVATRVARPRVQLFSSSGPLLPHQEKGHETAARDRPEPPSSAVDRWRLEDRRGPGVGPPLRSGHRRAPGKVAPRRPGGARHTPGRAQESTTLPSLLPACSVNHSTPPGPTASANGWLAAVGTS